MTNTDKPTSIVEQAKKLFDKELDEAIKAVVERWKKLISNK